MRHPPRGRRRRPLRSWRLPDSLFLTCLSAGFAAPALAQSTNAPSADPVDSVVTTYFEAYLPNAPWMSDSASPTPRWLANRERATPLVRPGLGTASIGQFVLPPVIAPGRDSSGTPPIPLGPFDLRLALGYGLVYGTGLLSDPGRTEATFQHSLSPSLRVLAGDHWVLGYTPTIKLYSAEGYENAVDHAVTVGGWATYRDWRYSFDHGSSLAMTPLVETGRQTRQVTHSTGVGAAWNRGSRGDFSFSLSQNLRFAEDVPDSYGWLNQNWYDRPWTDRLSFGLGLGLGYDLQQPGADMPNQRPSARLTGRLGDKIAFTLRGGAEFREFSGSTTATKTSPLVGMTVAYDVLEQTSLSLGFAHDTGTSYVENSFTENTSFDAGLTRVIRGSWTMSVGGGYRFTVYRSTIAGDSVSREDGSSFASVSLNGRLGNHLSLSLSYSYRANDSDQAEFSFDSHQVSLQLAYSL